MKAYVFNDKALERFAGRFVWLSIDTEHASSAGFLKKFPINVWPTLLVVDPANESVALRYVGGATTTQLTRLLTDGERVVRGKARASSDTLLLSADKLAAAKKNAEAAKVYEQAIAGAPKNWASFGRATESYLFALMMSKNHAQCATAARDLYRRVKQTPSAGNVAVLGLDCAVSLQKTDARRPELIKVLEAATREALHDPKVSISSDDRSGLYGSLVHAREETGDPEGARKLREEWATFLEAAAAKGTTPEQRAVYDSHRLSVYLALGTPEKAVPMLEQSERDFPTDYNPPSRLILAYRAMKRYDDALAASDRALSRAYGPNKIGIYRRRADVLLAKGDKESARRAIEDAIAHAKSLPAEQLGETTLASLEKKLTEIAQ